MYESFKLAVTTLVLPPGGPLLLVVLGAVAQRRVPRTGRALVLVGAAALWLFSLPVVANALVSALGGAKPLDLAAATKADAIVILGGGVRAKAVEYGGDTMGRLTLERTRYGASVARTTGLPIAVTGGAPVENVRSEADLMRESLEGEYGLDVRWVDSQSRNTRENASNMARILQADGRRRIVLVMHGFDVFRSQRLFERAGLEVVAAPTQVQRWDEMSAGDFLPSAAALQTSHFAAYELLAIARDAFITQGR